VRQEVAAPTRRCHATGRELLPGEGYYSALVETLVGTQRWDFAIEAWTGPPEGTVGYWRTTLPISTTPPPPREVPTETMLDFFDQLSQQPEKLGSRERRLRFVLALLLVRKRALKLHSVRREDSQDFLVVRRPSSKETIDVLDPGLNEAETSEVEKELADWMQSAMGDLV
jgi:hypothetical protein